MCFLLALAKSPGCHRMRWKEPPTHLALPHVGEVKPDGVRHSHDPRKTLSPQRPATQSLASRALPQMHLFNSLNHTNSPPPNPKPHNLLVLPSPPNSPIIQHRLQILLL